MSIQTELTRITNAKAAIKAAIEGKGVTVPDGTLLDGMATLIESIEAGGGGGITYAEGTITPAENITGPFLIEHNLGEKPSMFVFWRKSYSTIKQKNEIISLVDSLKSNSQLRIFVDSSGFWTSVYSSGLTGASSSGSYVNDASSTDLKLGISSSTLFAGNTYIWYAFLGVE